MSNTPPSGSGSLDFAEWFLKRVLIGAVALLAIVLAIVWGVRTFGPTGPAAGVGSGASSAETRAAGVMLVIEHASNVRLTYPSLAVAEGATVMDVLKAAENSPSRSLRVESSGSGQTAFVKAIDGVSNETGRDGRYWQFSVNGRYSQTGAGVTTVRPGDTVTFSFGAYVNPDAAASPGPPSDESGGAPSPKQP